ncbi:ABC transporter permease subunit [Streptomyces benahoarensis]|uniref:ABC transporter permease subunit n=2 Tax=Streptomyces benahoarensis TaxID=2595054 RepID=A0A553Z1D6_9ACTN|nr:ABC transporter permease subunit [Streptomyces benahoarensis]
MLTAQQLPAHQGDGPPPQPLAAGGGLAKEPGTMMLKAPAAPPGQPGPGAPQPGAPVPAGQPGPAAQIPQAGAPQAPQPPAQGPGAPAQQPGPAFHQGQPHPGAPQGAPAGYTSPIPVRSTHLGHALASEWTKIRSVRSTLWTLGALFVLIFGIGTLTALALGTQRYVDPKLGMAFFGVLLGTLCIIPLGVLVISSEYGTGMIRTTMTACPRRARVLAAKAIVFTALAFVITTITTTLVAVLTNGMVSGPDPTSGEWFRVTVGAGLYVSVLGLLALAVGSLLRHSAGAISAMLGLVLLPMLLAVFMLGSESLKSVSKALIEYSVPNSLASLYGNPFLGTDTGPQGWEPLWILIGVTAVVLGAAFAAQSKRDV